jgi:hypothetical protein
MAVGNPGTALAQSGTGEWVWVEGEKPLRSAMNRHPWWYDQVKQDQLSGGDLISNFHEARAGEAEYRFTVRTGGEYVLWVRCNPVKSRISYRLDDGSWRLIATDQGARDVVNIARDEKPDLRFLAWFRAGEISLRAGSHTVRFRMDSEDSNHGYLDCFVLAAGDFEPRGKLKPDQLGEERSRIARMNAGWFGFEPGLDPSGDALVGGLDLRSLNEREAGEGGFIGVRDGMFVQGEAGRPIRFWGVNITGEVDAATARRQARLLARRGVNLVRIHGACFDRNGVFDRNYLGRLRMVIAAMKAEGIYSHLSIYFPLWFKPKADHPWMRGYTGEQPAFAALFFDPRFQEEYRGWWRELLTSSDPVQGGGRLADEPAVLGLELVNEDSYLFWTFSEEQIPGPMLEEVEGQFGAWAKARYGTLERAIMEWGGVRHKRDDLGAGRLGFRGHWNIAHERRPRDQDTVWFLVESQRRFFAEMKEYLRVLGAKSLIVTSNWTTADARVLGPLEKYISTVGDFVDRHGYFGCNEKGEHASWSVREGHTYRDRSALRFESEGGGQGFARNFMHPVMDPTYDDKPSMISETTFNRPNRYRSEAPLYYASYGALQGTDAVVHFAMDGSTWTVKPQFFMQPWTLMSPAMLGQFPAAALIFRKGLVAPGELLLDLQLGLEDLYALKGTPLPQDASLDELRKGDTPTGQEFDSGERIDPLIHYAGRTRVRFEPRGTRIQLKDLSPLIDRKRSVVTSSTGELVLDYGRGVLAISAPRAQGISGALSAAGVVDLGQVRITSPLELGHIVVVSLDDQPLERSGRMLLQAMSEEKANGFATEPAGEGQKRIRSIGTEPWLVKDLAGRVELKRPDAKRLKATALDLRGVPAEAAGPADAIQLKRDVIYYLIER